MRRRNYRILMSSLVGFLTLLAGGLLLRTRRRPQLLQALRRRVSVLTPTE